jgi:hypothetical protein
VVVGFWARVLWQRLELSVSPMYEVQRGIELGGDVAGRICTNLGP